jgi:hypothetical protein
MQLAPLHKERSLLEDDELEDLWNCITSVIQRRPPEPDASASSAGGGGGGGGGGLLAGLPPIAVADTAAAADAESRVGYDELCQVRDEFAARLDNTAGGAAASSSGGGVGGGAGGGGGDGSNRIAHYFSAKTFNRFKRDANGRVNGRTFMEFVVRLYKLNPV